MTENTEAAPARGWPKGKPRKPQIETPDEFLTTMGQRVEEDRARMQEAAHENAVANTARSGQRGEVRPLKRTPTAVDKFHVPPSSIPDGMSYEWKRYTYGGKVDQDHMRNMMEQHWTPVPAERHPSMSWLESTSKFIEKEGMILMERPAYLTEEAHRERLNASAEQINAKMKQLQADGKSKEFDKTYLKSGYDLSVADDA